MLSVNVYVGLNAFEETWRASFPLANMSGSRVEPVQYFMVSWKMVSLKTWLFPKYASVRLQAS
jgi:hypothetical protein